MSDVKKDPIRIARDEHDPVKKCKKVSIVETEMSIELDHKDGDSVTSHPAKLVVKAEGVDASDNGQEIIPPMDCSSLRRLSIRVNGSGTVKVMLSPEDSGDFFYEAGLGEEIEICARRVKVISEDAEGDVHLVGRS